jgi:hypothetical protein
MRTYRGPRVDTTILGAATLFALAMGNGGTPDHFRVVPAQPMATLAGDWRTADGAVRLTLGADATFASSVAGRREVAAGTYRVDGAGLHLQDRSGLRTTGVLFGDALELAGHRLFRS